MKKVLGKRGLYLIEPPQFLQPWHCHPCEYYCYQRFCLVWVPFTDSKLFLRLPPQTCFNCHIIKPMAWQTGRHGWRMALPPLSAPLYLCTASWKKCKSSDGTIPIFFFNDSGSGRRRSGSPHHHLHTDAHHWPTFDFPIPALFSEEMKEACSHLPHIKL